MATKYQDWQHMHKEATNKKLVPALRFPAFKNDREWGEKPLNEILDYERPDNYIVSNTDYVKDGTPVLTAIRVLY